MPVRNYNKIHFLTKAAQRRLFEQRRYGELLMSVEPFIVNRMKLRGIPAYEWEDCYQFLWEYLLTHVHKFRPRKGRITTWVHHRLRAAFNMWKGHRRFIWVPQYHSDKDGALAKTAEKYAAQAHATVSFNMDAMFDTPGRCTAFHESECDRLEQLAVDRKWLDAELQLLNKDQHAVIVLRMAGLTLKQVGEYLDVTKERVRQIQDKALELLVDRLTLQRREAAA